MYKRATSVSENVMTTDEINRRAGGRKGYNKRRQWFKQRRQMGLGKLARKLGLGLFMRGTAAALARQLGLSRSTVSRDIDAILWELNHGDRAKVNCPCCATLVRRDQIHFPHNLAAILGVPLPEPDEDEEADEPEEQDEPDETEEPDVDEQLAETG
jgi:hypothetical protein